MTQTQRWQPWMGVQIALTEDGMTQKQLADLLGWDPSKISRILDGSRELRIGELEDIARVQGRDFDWYRRGFDHAKGDYLSSYLALAPTG